ncbi:50S ribosomal protein l32 chloroplastic [Phtheirospermum japonicum]|uniref:50S ribosomal protein l32 chloroplastic n=1 Tax=Phtheirospermum japonicum TaxID=374723 RepID=A0A830B645_9LAMI|nr:50S ribosomal protein l32 chloroplastic [Phtheirospermum japonicum]
MVVPKKYIFTSKECIRKIFWKRKGYWIVLKSFFLGKSLSTDNSKGVLSDKQIK